MISPSVSIPRPRPVESHHCPGCGYDPVILWDGHSIMGGDWRLRKDLPTQLCPSCALERAWHLWQQYGEDSPDWPPEQKSARVENVNEKD